MGKDGRQAEEGEKRTVSDRTKFEATMGAVVLFLFIALMVPKMPVWVLLCRLAVCAAALLAVLFCVSLAVKVASRVWTWINKDRGESHD